METSSSVNSKISSSKNSSSKGSAEVSNNDNFNLGIKLNGGGNHSIWSQLLENHATGKGKKGYLTGRIKEPDEEDDGYEKWEMENAIVRGWLLQSMEPDIVSIFIRLRTAKQIWDAAYKMYNDVSDLAKIYELRCKATSVKQKGRSVAQYFAELTMIWQEYDERRPNRMKDPEDVKIRQEELEIDRVVDFLAGLDIEYDKIRSDLFRMTPIPKAEEAYNAIRREAQRIQTMTEPSEGREVAVAMASKAPSTSRNTASRPTYFPRENKEDLKCTFCEGKGHIEETCFKKHGKPEWFIELRKKQRAEERMRQKGRGKAAVAAADGGFGGEAGAEKEAVKLGVAAVAAGKTGGQALSLINQISNTNSSGAGKIGRALVTSEVEKDTGWIIDSGATDHMTYDKSLFRYMNTPNRTSVATANGEITPVMGAGTIDLSSSLSLHHCLLVPSLSNHLLSVGQVTEQLDCFVLIYPSFCLLQDIRTKEIIGRGSKRGGVILCR